MTDTKNLKRLDALLSLMVPSILPMLLIAAGVGVLVVGHIKGW